MSDPKKYPDPQPFTDKARPQIALTPVASNQVKAIGYDAASKTLAVTFTRGAGAIYHYPNVDQETFEAFKSAESIGRYFGSHIQGLPFDKFQPEPAAESEAAA